MLKKRSRKRSTRTTRAFPITSKWHTWFSFSSSAILRRCASHSFWSVSARTFRSVMRHFCRSRNRLCAALQYTPTQASKGATLSYTSQSTVVRKPKLRDQQSFRSTSRLMPHLFFSLAHFSAPPRVASLPPSDEVPAEASSLSSGADGLASGHPRMTEDDKRVTNASAKEQAAAVAAPNLRQRRNRKDAQTWPAHHTAPATRQAAVKHEPVVTYTSANKRAILSAPSVASTGTLSSRQIRPARLAGKEHTFVNNAVMHRHTLFSHYISRPQQF